MFVYYIRKIAGGLVCTNAYNCIYDLLKVFEEITKFAFVVGGKGAKNLKKSSSSI